MKTNDFSYFIERYIAGEMSDSEKQWFLKELDGNTELQNEVNLRKQTENILMSKDIISLRNKLNDIERVREKRTAFSLSRLRKQDYMKYAAIFTGMIMIVSILLVSGNKMSGEEVLNKFYQVYEIPAAQRSGQTVAKDDFTLAVEFYNTHDYENAAILFNKVEESNPRDMQSVLLYGVSNFEDKNYPTAKQSFIKVIDDNDNLFIETAEWYLALCYIRTNEKDKAFQQLELIRDGKGIYSKSAGKIIRKLK